MEKKPKYSLFPPKPSASVLELVPSAREPSYLQPPLTPDQPSPPEGPLPPEKPLFSEDSSLSKEPPPPPAESLPPEEVLPPEISTPPEAMHTPSSSSSSSSSSESSLKPIPLSSPSPTLRQRNRPQTTYFHNGVGGAGNYHKLLRDTNGKLISNAPTVTQQRPRLPRSLTSLFSSGLGNKSNKKESTHHNHDSKYSVAAAQGGASEYSDRALPLGAAEVMRRKLLRQSGGAKRSTSSGRS